MSPGRQRLVRDIALIMVAPFLLYLLVCLFTFSPQDPGWSHSGSVTAPLENARKSMYSPNAPVILLASMASFDSMLSGMGPTCCTKMRYRPVTMSRMSMST